MKGSARYLVIAFAVLAGAVVLLSRTAEDSDRGQEAFQQRPEAFEEREATVGGVAMSVQPTTLSDGTLQVSLVFNAHSGDLSSYDPQEHLRLRSGGSEVPPLRADNAAGSGPSGHHREISVVFPEPEGGVFTLLIGGLGESPIEMAWP